MIIYTCPKCGGAIYHTYMPPIDIWGCRDCGWEYEEKTALNIDYSSHFKPNSMKIGQ